MGEFDLDGRSVTFEIVEAETQDGEITNDISGDFIDTNELERVVYWYEPVGGDREYGTVYGPFNSEGDMEAIIIDTIEVTP